MVQEPHRCEDPDRRVPASLQRGQATFEPRAADAGRVQTEVINNEPSKSRLPKQLRSEESRQVSTYSDEYYRIALHRRNQNQQHRRLLAHAQANSNTYYVAPEFNSLDEFNAAFLNKQITARSRLIPVRECADIYDGSQHYITFQGGDAQWIQHSERTSHHRSFTGSNLEDLYHATRDQWRPFDDQYARELLTRTVAAAGRSLRAEGQVQGLPPLFDFDATNASRSATLMRVAEILSVTLGVTLVLVGSQG